MFETKLTEVSSVAPIQGADNLDVFTTANGRQYVGEKGEFEVGDPVVTILPGAIVPEELLNHLGLVGRLNGAQRNKLRTRVIRGVESNALLISGYTAFAAVMLIAAIGLDVPLPTDDLSDFFGIKYDKVFAARDPFVRREFLLVVREDIRNLLSLITRHTFLAYSA